MTTSEVTDRLLDDTVPRLFEVSYAVDHILSLADRFVLPPFSVLDGRSGSWQERKRLWLSLGIQSEIGRVARTFAKSGNADEVSQKILALSNGQSIFDPVLCEMAYHWFVPPGGRVLDPFAGGSVRGITAAVTRRRYTGIDLSQEQIDANYDQDACFLDRGMYTEEYAPSWLVGDALERLSAGVAGHVPDLAEPFDFIFTCPPYFNLEVYSDDPRDLSNMAWDRFVDAYGMIIKSAVELLHEDRFAAIVVSEIRDGGGMYRDFVGTTIRAFEAAGAAYYNEAVFISPAGTLPIRAAKQFVATRKLGRTHQTVLLFVKGNPKVAADACSEHRAIEAALRAGGRTVDDLDQPDEPEEVLHG